MAGENVLGIPTVLPETRGGAAGNPEMRQRAICHVARCCSGAAQSPTFVRMSCEVMLWPQPWSPVLPATTPQDGTVGEHGPPKKHGPVGGRGVTAAPFLGYDSDSRCVL
jgi:hypothetical protein